MNFNVELFSFYTDLLFRTFIKNEWRSEAGSSVEENMSFLRMHDQYFSVCVPCFLGNRKKLN